MGSDADRQLAVVTGASSGIGFHLAREFAEHGFDLVVAAEDAELSQARADLEHLGAHVEAVQVDLSTREGVEELASRVGDRPVAALALNAGIGMGGDFVRDTDLEQELRMVDLNCRSTVHLAKRLLPGMVERGAGRVLVTSSVASTMPGPYQAVYNATKSFTQSFAEAIREELKDTGVTVTSLMPGPTETEFFDRADMRDTKIGSPEGNDDPADVAKDGFEALMAGKQQVVAGAKANSLQARAGRLVPDALKAKGHAAMAKPGSASDDD
ncbi:SDR family oxidoreductase [Conexibacter sp. SYSU D00693]|uniref:SDR family NAD(P)-dependent oxidoreductase n=1 Tax=Conexibacter sp. SYSU D00693 TaxID=2812560 RepID=UPI00196B0091|nr:SDR family NAD(P)-dependent oxidoreductase [Conexibacter sp. SYSU D00693]